MKWLNTINPELLELLEEYQKWVYSQDYNGKHFFGQPDSEEFFTSEEYLKEMQATKDTGYPEHTHSTDFSATQNSKLPHKYKMKFFDYVRPIVDFVGARNNAAAILYPKDGWLSWHNNHNAPGYNVLFSYSETGNGWFRYQNPETKEIVTMQDKPGWSCKVGYFGSKLDDNKVFWHCARTYETRLTLGFVVPDKYMWEMMCEEIEC